MISDREDKSSLNMNLTVLSHRNGGGYNPYDRIPGTRPQDPECKNCEQRPYIVKGDTGTRGKAGFEGSKGESGEPGPPGNPGARGNRVSESFSMATNINYHGN